MHKILFFILFTGILIPSIADAQSAAINTDGSNADASAILDVKSTNKGMLVPRMTTAQRTAIASPAKGLLVFDTDANAFWFHNGTTWIQIAAGIVSPWAVNGTHINNTNTGNVGIGYDNPPEPLSILHNSGSFRGLLVKSTNSFAPSTISIDAGGGLANLVFKNNGTLRWVMQNFPDANNVFRLRDLAADFTKLYIQPGFTGNVGIDTENPTHKLTVLGSGNLALFKSSSGYARVEIESTNSSSELSFKDNGSFKWTVRSDPSTNRFIIYEHDNGIFARLAINAVTGNVGIGSSNPSQRLDVNGNAEISGNLTVNNGRGIVRSTNSTQLKVFRNQIVVPAFTIGPGAWVETGFFDYENFSATPQVYIGNILSYSSADWMKINIMPVEVATTGCKFRVYNMSTSTVTNLTVTYQFMAIGAQ